MSPMSRIIGASSLLSKHSKALNLVQKRKCCNDVEVPSPASSKIKNLQKKFQADDGVPVYLKKGYPDKVLFNISLFGTAFGLLYGVYTLVFLVAGFHHDIPPASDD